MRIAICDDEDVFTTEVYNTVSGCFAENKLPVQIDVFSDSEKLCESRTRYDMAFLDIEMPHYSGMETARRLRKINADTVIFFITSHNKYLDEAFDCGAFRYIEKPIDRKRLEAGLQKAISQTGGNTGDILVRKQKSVIKMAVSDIQYFEISGRYTKAVTAEDTYISVDGMDALTEKLEAFSFFRVHKSYLINMKYIKRYSRCNVVLSIGKEIPIAEKRQARFREYIHFFYGDE